MSVMTNGMMELEEREKVSLIKTGHVPSDVNSKDRTAITYPSEGWEMLFDDGKRRIDFVLMWEEKPRDKEATQRQADREKFLENLRDDGIQTEHYHREGKCEHFVKIHAPFEVLTRYAELMKTRMPIKEAPEEILTLSIWEMLTDTFKKLLRPIQLDPVQVPPIPKTFTHVYERNKSYLFDIPESQPELFFSHSQRSLIVDFILRRTEYGDTTHDSFAFSINRLLQNGAFTAAFPLHEGPCGAGRGPNMRKLLYDNWAHSSKFYKQQPLDYIRMYFGERIGLYFAWLGYYTFMLCPASIVGVVVFIYGISTVDTDIVAGESCDASKNFTMCPKCDKRCDYWNLASACGDITASHWFDNPATVFFSIFMSFWGTFFLEFWKREESSIQFKWNTMNFEEEEQPPRPEYLLYVSKSNFIKKNPVSRKDEPFLPFWRRRVPVYLASASSMLFLVSVAVAIIIGVYVYRMVTLAALYARDEELVYNNASMVTSATAACINLLAIFILNFVYSKLAVVLTDWECQRTQSEYDSSLTFKLYVLQFVNYYSSLFYIAFFKGRFNGRPGDYNTLFGARQEECAGGGCLMELVIQLAIIFVGKQLIQNTLLEILIPRIKKKIKLCRRQGDQEAGVSDLKPWELDCVLDDLDSGGLFHEYLEMMIQFGFVTIFVAAFPLAPLFALINNILEIRTDANKFCTQLRRPLAARAATIGVWFDILLAVSRIAVLSNAFIIAFTTGFIHRLVYFYKYADEPENMTGYVNWTLSYFNVSDFEEDKAPVNPDPEFSHIELCRYRDYREPPWSPHPYSYTSQFWHVLAAQFIFVVVFENVVIVFTNFMAYIIPDMPRKLREQVRREAYLVTEIIIETERGRAQRHETERHHQDSISDTTMDNIRRRANALDPETTLGQTGPAGDAETGIIESTT